MKRIIAFSLLLAFALSLCLSLVPETALAMTGSGTEGDPYIIYDVDDLQNMSNNLTAYYELANDIDASATSGWNVGAGFIPVGDSGTEFTGTFDGAGYTISDLYINRDTTDYVGLFGDVDGATIQDVTLAGFDITGDDNVGALAGETLSTTISDVTITNLTVTGADYAGGAIGYSYQSILSDVAVTAGTITAHDYSGGVIGYSYQDDVDDSYSTSAVNATIFNAGGFTSYALDSDFDNCYATGATTLTETDATTYYAGGFAGRAMSASTFTKCYATGAVSGNYYIGGFIGRTGSDAVFSKCYATGDVTGTGTTNSGEAGGFAGGIDSSGCSATDCYARGDVDCSGVVDYDLVGGFVGYLAASSTITNAYSTGLVAGDEYIGGFCGENAGTITSCFWDTQTSGTEDSDGGVGRPTVEMKCETLYTNADWDFDTIWTIDSSYNDRYPCFLWQYFWLGEFYQVLWFQPNAIIEGTTLPDRAETEDGTITWGANPAGITMSYGEFIPEEEYDFEPIMPDNPDIIKPEPEVMTGDVDLVSLRDHPLYLFVQILSIDGFLNERLVWIGLAWLTTIIAMFLVHIGPDTHRNSKKPHHFILTVATGLGLSILWWSATVFPYWVIIMMGVGLIPAIIWERQPVI